MAYGNGLGMQNQVTNVLICGNTKFLTQSALEMVSDNYTVVVVGQVSHLKRTKKRILLYDFTPQDERFQRLFDAYSVDVVWYYTGFMDGANAAFNENAIVDAIEAQCVRSAIQKLIVVNSTESLNMQARYRLDGNLMQSDYASSLAFAVAQEEKLFQFYESHNHIKTILLRLPYIATEHNADNFLGSIFRCMYENTPVHFPYSAENQVDFVTALDLAELLILITEEVSDKSASYNISSGHYYTWQMLQEQIHEIKPEQQVECDEAMDYRIACYANPEAFKTYGFVASDNVHVLFHDYYQNYVQAHTYTWSLKGVFTKVADFFMKSMLQYVELILFFLLAEFLVLLTTNSPHFKYVDIRLFYVLLLGSAHGMLIGILAGVLECCSLLWAFFREGATGTMLFYNLNNWIPFAVYLMTGSITGYIRSQALQSQNTLQDTLSSLREKYLFLMEAYKGVITHKGEYKRQILGYQDSFGKIFNAVQKLDSSLPSDIFMNGVQTLEGILNNHSVAIYTVDSWQKFGRLVASSGELLTKLPKSLKLADVQPVYDCISQGKTWKNTALNPGYPMYAYAVQGGDGKVSVIITLYSAGTDQQSLYYLNLFTIMCNLIRMSFLRALDYQKAIEREQYYPNTHILYPGYFEKALKVQQNMANTGIADFTLIKFESDDKAYIENAVRGVIRQNDILGCGDDETIYLICTQTNESNFHFVGNRLDSKGLRYSRVSG